MTNTVKDAYKIVFNDMINSECDLLVGKYDAKMVIKISCMALALSWNGLHTGQAKNRVKNFQQCFLIT